MSVPGASFLRRFLVAAALVALAGGAEAAPRLAEIRFGRDGHARIPFELRTQHVWLRGTINSKDSVWIVVDTGASASVVDDGVAKRLGLRVTGEHEAHGAAGTQVGHTAHDVTIELPGLSVHRKDMNTIDLSALTMMGGRPMQAILGYELFRSCVVRFDYAASVMDVWDADHAPADAPGATVPMTLIHNHPYVEGTVALPGGRTLSGKFVIDTGSSLALLLAPNAIPPDSIAAVFPRTMVAIGRGVGGELRNLVARGEWFELGSLRFARPTVVLADSGSHISVPGSIGNIGGQILDRCSVTFDYPHGRVRFEPGADFDRPFEADMSGLTAMRDPQGLAVRWVNPGTPASEAGLEAGDRILSVDGEPAERVDPAALRLRLQREGQAVTLEVVHGGAPRTVTLTLRRLI